MKKSFESQFFSEKAEKKEKFKVGDKVIGNEKASEYLITGKGWAGVIKRITEDGRIKVSDGEGTYDVSSEHFDLVETKTEETPAPKIENSEAGNQEDIPIVDKREEMSEERPPILPVEIDENQGKVFVLETELPLNKESDPLVPNEENFRHFTLDKRTLETIGKAATAVELKEPCLLEGETSTSKTSSIEYLAMTTRNGVERINLNGQTDTSELIGKFIPNDGQLQIEFEQLLAKPELLAKQSEEILQRAHSEGRGLTLVESQKIAQAEDIKIPDWRWQDGMVPEAMRNGRWIILDEINLAEAQILERLNSVLEKNPVLTLSENGGMKIGEGGDFEVHPNFRIFATMNPAEYTGRQPMSPAYKDRWTSYKFVEAPSQEDYMAMMELIVYGEHPNVEIRGERYRGEKTESLYKELETIPNFKGFLAKLAKFQITLEDLARRRVIGKNKKEKYIFTRRGLLSFFDYLENKTIIDRKSKENISIKDDPKKVILRALQEKFLDKLANTEDLKKVKDQLDAIGISEENWTHEFSEKPAEEELDKEEEKEDLEKLEGRNPEEFLEDFFDWSEEERKWSDRDAWDWELSEDGKLVNMKLSTEKFPSEYADKELEEIKFEKGVDGASIDDLIKKLRDKKVFSLLVENHGQKRWYLEVVDKERKKKLEKMGEFSVGDKVIISEDSDVGSHRGEEGEIIDITEEGLEIHVGSCNHVFPVEDVKKKEE